MKRQMEKLRSSINGSWKGFRVCTRNLFSVGMLAIRLLPWWLRRFSVFVPFFIITCIVLLPVILGLGASLSSVCNYLGMLDYPYVSWAVYLMLSCFVVLPLAVTTGVLAAIKIFPSTEPRDVDYLRRTAENKNKNGYATRFDELVSRICGEGATANDRKMVESMISETVEPIKTFLLSPCEDNNTLVVQGGWGTGKTTAVLVAIDQLESVASYRFVNESAFKYTRGIREFSKDIVSSIDTILRDEGIKVRAGLRGILSNLGSSPVDSLLKFVRVDEQTSDVLTSEFVHSINSKYERRKSNIKLVIILDDLDRLQGNDVIEALSLLSVLRRLCFVKIILPIDNEAVVAHLGSIGIHKPEVYIEKYLPERTAAEVKSNYRLIEKIALEKIRGVQPREFANENPGTTFLPTWAAILVKMYADRMRKDAGKAGVIRLGNWLMVGAGRTVPPEMQKDSSYIFEAPSALANTAGSNPQLAWDNNGAGTVSFEDVIYALSAPRGSMLKDDFTQEAYVKYVASWVFQFADNRWQRLNMTPRGITEILQRYDFTGTFETEYEQFVHAYNVIFPDKQLKAHIDEEPEA